MTNHLVATFLPRALQGQPTSTVELPREITNATYSAAVRFMYKRYLAGQAILAATVNEQSWLARRTPLTTEPGDLVPLLVRIIRGSPGATITMADVLEIDLDMKRDMRVPNSPHAQAALLKLQNLWQMMIDVGVGQCSQDTAGNTFLPQVQAIQHVSTDLSVVAAK